MMVARRASSRSSRAEKIRKAILELDRFRYGTMIDPSKLEKYILDSGLGKYWPVWKSHINRALKKRLNDPLTRKYTLIKFGLRMLAMLSIIVANLMLFVTLINPRITFVNIILNPLIAISLILIVPYICLVIYYFIGKLSISKTRMSPSEDDVLRKIIDELLLAFSMEAKRIKLNKKNLELELIFNDYKNIEIIKEKNKKYIVVPKIEY